MKKEYFNVQSNILFIKYAMDMLQLDNNAIDDIISRCDLPTKLKIIRSGILYNELYEYALCAFTGEPTNMKFMTVLDKEKYSKEYNKLYTTCPYLETLPEDEDMIVAGGFINIAVDNELSYEQFPSSDIDIFICGKNYGKYIRPY